MTTQTADKHALTDVACPQQVHCDLSSCFHSIPADDGSMTLEEWEARQKGWDEALGGPGGKPWSSSSQQVLSDEELARQLQAQLDGGCWLCCCPATDEPTDAAAERRGC